MPANPNWILEPLSTTISNTLKPQGVDIEASSITPLLESPADAKLGDLALPCFSFAKALKQSPVKIAASLAQTLKEELPNVVLDAQAVQGFLNIFLKPEYLATELVPALRDSSYFSLCAKSFSDPKRRVMIEFSNPNTHKEFHVGHLRNVCLGDSITRMFSFLGYDAVPVNYIGDEGTHVAKCLWQTGFDQAPGPEDRATLWYGKRYVEANARLKEASPELKPKLEKEVSQVLHEIEKKNGPYYDLWLKSKKECLEDFKNIYSWLGVHFEHDFFESDVSEGCQKIVDDWLAKGLFYESNGAIGLSLEPEGLGFFMARKSDGTSLYITKDLELAKRKFEQFGIDRSIYVVGNEQNFHFKQLFCVLEKMGFKNAENCIHLSYAHVNLVSGKISSRQGNAYAFYALKELLESELDPYLTKYADNWSAAQMQEARRKLAIAAIKYGMLAADPNKEITFDPAIWTSFEGNTGPYLLYAYSRSQSILEKGGIEKEADLSLLTSEEEKQLLLKLLVFNNIVTKACLNHRPSTLANYLYELAKCFNRFYAGVAVLKAETESLRQSRLALVQGFGMTLKRGLDLLGIESLDKM